MVVGERRGARPRCRCHAARCLSGLGGSSPALRLADPRGSGAVNGVSAGELFLIGLGTVVAFAGSESRSDAGRCSSARLRPPPSSACTSAGRARVADAAHRPRLSRFGATDPAACAPACAGSGAASTRAAAPSPRARAGRPALLPRRERRRRAGSRSRSSASSRLRAWPRESWETAVTRGPSRAAIRSFCDSLRAPRRARRRPPRSARRSCSRAGRRGRRSGSRAARSRRAGSTVPWPRSRPSLIGARRLGRRGVTRSERAERRRTARARRSRARAPAAETTLATRRRRRRPGARAGPIVDAVARAARCRSRCWRQVPTIATGTITSSEVASASSWVEPRKIASAGTKRMPPPTPSRPPTAPPASAKRDRERDVHQGMISSIGDDDEQQREEQRDGALGQALLERRRRAPTPITAGTASSSASPASTLP